MKRKKRHRKTMPAVKYDNLPNAVGELLKPASYATTATVPVSPTTSLVFTTGHIGLDLKTGDIVNDTPEHEFEAVFSCLNAALVHAGAKEGLRNAYKFVAYLVKVEDEAVMQQVFKRMFPGHTPTWITAMVERINVKGMRAEIAAEGVIFDIDGQKG